MVAPTDWIGATPTFMISFLSVALLASSASVFGVRQSGGVWSFTRPDGSTFWSLGCDCVDLGTAPKDYKEDRPSYSALRIYPSEDAWVKGTVANLKQWGYNSLGAWSNSDLLGDSLPFFTCLHLGAWYRAPFEDLFSPEFEKTIDLAARTEIPKVVNNPNLVGYFTDNELGWWGDTLFIKYNSFAPSSPGKKALTGLLKKHYRNDFSSLQRDWNTSGKSFADLGTLTLKPRGNGIQVVNEWTALLAKRYYRVVRDAVRRYDKRRLIVGDRYCQYYDLNVVRASTPYIDAASTNYGCEWTDGTLSHFYLDTLYELTRKPVVITEFYVNAMENRSGNQNTGHAFPVVQTQEERASCFRQNVLELARRPYVIGAHWFQFWDEPTHGRSDGEDCNMGLVDIQGRPYDLMVEATRSINLDSIRSSLKAPAPAAKRVIPMASSDPMIDLQSWPRSQGWVPPDGPAPFGDLYLCRDENALYLGVMASDYVDDKLYESERVPESERAELTITIDQQKPITIRFGSDRKALYDRTQCHVTEKPGLKHVLLVRIKASGKRLTASVTQHSRANKMSWSADLNP